MTSSKRVLLKTPILGHLGLIGSVEALLRFALSVLLNLEAFVKLDVSIKNMQSMTHRLHDAGEQRCRYE